MSSTDGYLSARWTPFVVLDANAWLGLFDSSLFVGTEAEPQRALDMDDPIGMLPLLARPAPEVKAEIAASEERLGLVSGELAARVPISRLLHTAVAAKSDYWTGLALAWVESRAIPATPNALEAIARATWASQKTRHHARALRKAIRGQTPYDV